jgi:hypothetical protein
LKCEIKTEKYLNLRFIESNIFFYSSDFKENGLFSNVIQHELLSLFFISHTSGYDAAVATPHMFPLFLAIFM